MTLRSRVLVTVKVPEAKIQRSLRPGLLREKSSRRTSASSTDDIVKVNVTIAPGLQVKDPSRRPKRCTTLDVFRDSACCWCTSSYMGKTASDFGASRRGQRMEKDKKQCKDFLTGRKPKIPAVQTRKVKNKK